MDQILGVSESQKVINLTKCTGYIMKIATRPLLIEFNLDFKEQNYY